MNINKNKRIVWSIITIIILVVIGCCTVIAFNGQEQAPDNMLHLDTTRTENEFYVTEEDYDTTMTKVVEPYLEQYFEDGYFYNNETSLHFQSYILPDSKRSIVLSHGFTGYTHKLTEMIYYFLRNHYSVYIMEHRGHGYSDRESDDMSLVTISDFDDYLEDMKVFMDSVVLTSCGDDELYLYAHSMGGGISVGFLEQYPGYFKAAVLSTPMLEVNCGMPSFIASTVAKFMITFGKGDSYLPGQGSFEPVFDVDDSSAASDARFQYYSKFQVDDENYQTNGGSYRWLNAAVDFTNEITKKENLEKIDIPILMFQAEHDSLVLPGGHYTFANNVESCELVYVENSKHQIYSAKDEIFIPYLNTIFSFLEEQ